MSKESCFIKTVIMAGGKGTRIQSMAESIPKPMLPIAGKPVLEHQIECLRREGFIDIIISVCYLADHIINYFGDGSGISPATGEPFGVHIEYFIEKEPMGNAGALFCIKEKLQGDFLLINADIIFDVDLWSFLQFHKEKHGLITLLTHPNNHPYDSGIVVTDDDREVVEWLTKEDDRRGYYKNQVNAGIHILSSEVLRERPDGNKIDLDRQILRTFVGSGKMFAYQSSEYVKDMGTPQRFEKVQNDIRSGIVAAKNRERKQKCVFLDRDGVINVNVGFLKDIAAFELLPGVPEAIRTLNDIGALVIVITNQPVVARGEITEQELREIHNKMETLLGAEGAYVDAIYYCPHHPHRGFPGEVVEYKIECDCRKPKPGMLLTAAADWNIDLTDSWMIGDDKRDIEAGKAAGCKTALVANEGDFGQDLSVQSLWDFVEKYHLYEGERH